MAITATHTAGRPAAHLRPNTHRTYERGIDWIAVELAANGQLANPKSGLTDRERRAAWRLMLPRLSRQETARRTGASPHRVTAWANKHGYPPINPGRWEHS